MLQAQIESLQKKLILAAQDADVSSASENELKAKLLKLEDDFKKEEETMDDIVSDMTRQYKARQQELCDEENYLKGQESALKEDINQEQEQLDLLKSQKDAMEKEKDAEIKTLKKNIDDMSNNFANMLKETYDKMKERIAWADTQWNDEKTDGKLLKNFEQELGQK